MNPGCLAPNQHCWQKRQAVSPRGGGQGDPAGGDGDATGPGVAQGPRRQEPAGGDAGGRLL